MANLRSKPSIEGGFSRQEQLTLDCQTLLTRYSSTAIMPLHVATHPIIAHKMTILRDVNTSSQDYRRVLREITFYLGYEATRTLRVDSVEVTTSTAVTEGCKLVESVSIIPILRAGTGMCDAMLDLLPNAAIHHIGNRKILQMT